MFQIAKKSKPFTALSVREIDVLKLCADGLSNKHISTKLSIAEGTVDTHNRNIVRKLKAENMKHAIAIALRRKIIK